MQIKEAVIYFVDGNKEEYMTSMIVSHSANPPVVNTSIEYNEDTGIVSIKDKYGMFPDKIEIHIPEQFRDDITTKDVIVFTIEKLRQMDIGRSIPGRECIRVHDIVTTFDLVTMDHFKDPFTNKRYNTPIGETKEIDLVINKCFTTMATDGTGFINVAVATNGELEEILFEYDYNYDMRMVRSPKEVGVRKRIKLEEMPYLSKLILLNNASKKYKGVIKVKYRGTILD